ncbi:MAG: hypothetical protein QM736_26815 [Vicinamibacterales bacterium]
MHLWWTSTTFEADEALEERKRRLLSPVDLAACDRLLTIEGRRECLVSRCMLRELLSSYHPIPADAWRFHATESGKPEVDAPIDARALAFNISHAGGMVVCVVSVDREVGVDVEPCERRTPLALAESVLRTGRDRRARCPACGRQTAALSRVPGP